MRAKHWLTKGTRLMAVLVALLAMRQEMCAQQTDMAELSLEDLMNIEITTVGKRAQRMSRIPAAVYVITQEEIRRSGVMNVPDALRLVPGVEVAQIENSSWAISIRGANSISSNKLLVLIDGRVSTIQPSPTCSGMCRIPCWKTSSGSRLSAVRAPPCGAPML